MKCAHLLRQRVLEATEWPIQDAKEPLTDHMTISKAPNNTKETPTPLRALGVEAVP